MAFYKLIKGKKLKKIKGELEEREDILVLFLNLTFIFLQFLYKLDSVCKF